MRQERWKPIPGYRGYYEISDQGQIRSLTRIIIHKNGLKYILRGKVLKPTPNGKGYQTVSLYKNSKRKNFYLHRLVLLTFVGPCPPKMECCHKNGDNTDNRRANLRYGTPVSNNADKKRHGTHIEGSLQGSSVLTEKLVVRIRNTYAKGSTSCKQLAEEYGVYPQTIHNVLTRKTWKHVGGADCSQIRQAKKDKGGAKLTPRQVKVIRELYEEDGWTALELAENYNLSDRSIHAIVAYRSWKDV